jgi:GNAT superfamily N-acetyltransferase
MTQTLDLVFDLATAADAAALAAMRTRVAHDLTVRHGHGHWSYVVSERGVRRDIGTSKVLVARKGRVIVGTLRLVSKKPWAIDPVYFTAVRRPLYLVDMAVEPRLQQHGIGRRLIDEAIAAARTWPADALRLDAYQGPAGAGGFYERCRFREVGRATYRGTALIYYEHLL